MSLPSPLARVLVTHRVIVFDFDGVIVDSEPLKFTAYARVFRRHFGVVIDPVDKSWRGRSESAVVSHFRDRYHLGGPPDNQLLIEEKRREYETLLPSAPAVPGIFSWVSNARKAGFRLAVATTSPRAHVLPTISRLGFESAFEVIVAQEDVLRAKPAPDVYLEALRRLDCSARAVVAFEDTPAGVAAAEAAGILAIPVLTSFDREAFPGQTLFIRDFQTEE